MKFSLYQGMFGMSSQVMHTHLSNIHSLTRILGALTRYSPQFTPLHHVTASHSLQVISHQIVERAVRKNTVTYAPGPSTPFYPTNTIHSWDSQQTSQTLHFSKLLSTSYSPSLCSIQCYWNNYSII